VSPDGRFAALIGYSRHGRAFLRLLDLATRAGLPVSLPLSLTGPGSIAWSPDSRWLFAVNPAGRLFAVDPETPRVQGLGVSLPPLSELAIRA
jgi:hypothetical protein